MDSDTFTAKVRKTGAFRMMKNKNSATVYSTDPNWHLQEEPKEKKNVRQGTVYLRRESKGRGGKTVTVISGLVGDLKQWKKELQKLCGSGGTVKSNFVEIQGDHRKRIADFLREKGIKSKFAGG